MTAEIEIKPFFEVQGGQQNDLEDDICPEAPIGAVEQEYFFLKNEEYLQKSIPLSPGMQDEDVYNLCDNSQRSNYSKLEKALFGFRLQNSMDQE